MDIEKVAAEISINCTVVELKQYLRRLDKQRQAVLIVPLWNWNVFSFCVDDRRAVVLIVPLWNWNNNTSYFRIPKSSVLIVPLWNWNSVTATALIWLIPY